MKEKEGTKKYIAIINITEHNKKYEPEE